MHVRQNIFNGIIHASTSGESSNMKPSSSSEGPCAGINAQALVTKSNQSTNRNLDINSEGLEIEWEDFSEDFTISSLQPGDLSPEFATGTGKKILPPVADVSSIMELESIEGQGILRDKVPGLRSSTPKKHHFAAKESVKLKFHEKDDVPQKKMKIDRKEEKTNSSSVHSKENFELESRTRFDNCVFHNCTFHITQTPLEK